MAKLDYFTIQVETEEDWISTNIELNFICNDHITIIECDGVDENTDLNRVMTCLKSLFENETNCTYKVKQRLLDFTHLVSVYGGKDDPSLEFECDAIKITERDNEYGL